MQPIEILLVEDDHFKEEQVETLIKGALPDCVIRLARSVQQAVRSLRETTFDTVVLDIALPSHDLRAGAAQPISQPSGGIEVLLELSYDRRPERVIIVTQYPEIEFDGRLYNLGRAQKILSDNLSLPIVDVILFSPASDTWRQRLLGALT